MRHAMTNHIFKEVKPNVVAHTAASRILAEDPKMNDWAGFCLEDLWPVSVSSPFALSISYYASFLPLFLSQARPFSQNVNTSVSLSIPALHILNQIRLLTTLGHNPNNTCH
jgi:hypothetical protein